MTTIRRAERCEDYEGDTIMLHNDPATSDHATILDGRRRGRRFRAHRRSFVRAGASRMRRTMTAIGLTALATGGALHASSAPAGAASAWPIHASTTWNFRYGYSELRTAPYPWSPMIAGLGNPTVVNMLCWTDTAWYAGNYSSPRWFLVNAGGRTGYIHSSYVYNQAPSPHC